MVPATTRRQRHPRCPEASQAPQAPEARVVSTWLLASARFQGITTFPQRVPTVFHQWAHVVLLHRGLLPAGGGNTAQELLESCVPQARPSAEGRLRIRKWGCCADYSPQRCNPPACLAGSRSRSYRCPNFRLCCRHSHRYSNHPSMFINQTHHYHNYSPPDTSPHYNMQ